MIYRLVAHCDPMMRHAMVGAMANNALCSNALEVEVRLLREMLEQLREDRDAWREQAAKALAVLSPSGSGRGPSPMVAAACGLGPALRAKSCSTTSIYANKDKSGSTIVIVCCTETSAQRLTEEHPATSHGLGFCY